MSATCTNMTNYLKKIWKDPVWSKVIFGFILSIIPIVIEKKYGCWNTQITAIIILLIIIAILSCICNHLKKKANYLNHYDREDILLSNHYYYTLNPSKETLDVKITTERTIKALKKIHYLHISFSLEEYLVLPSIKPIS